MVIQRWSMMSLLACAVATPRVARGESPTTTTNETTAAAANETAEGDGTEAPTLETQAAVIGEDGATALPARVAGSPVTDTPAPSETTPPRTTPTEKKKRYTLPFMMRPGVAPNLVRVDAAYAIQDRAAVTASAITGGYKPFDGIDLGFYARAALVQSAPDGLKNAGAIGNPLLFALFTPEIAPKVRLGLFGGVTLPIGMGGGDVAKNDAVRAGVASGVYARQAMDNALFATNYMTPTTGASIAWIDKGFTLQAEATVLYLVRVRGEALDKEPARTNFTSGVHAGYLIASLVNVGVEAHYQRWLSTPLAVQRDDSVREQMTVGGGARFNVPLSDSILARPGIAYFHPIDDPMAKNGYRIVQADIPVAF